LYMRFLVVIFAVAVMALTGCDLELGGSGDQYKVTLDVTDGEQGIVYNSGSTGYLNVPVFAYHTSFSEGYLIASESSVALDEYGNITGGVLPDDSDYIFLKISSGAIVAAESKVRYQGLEHYPSAPVSISITTEEGKGANTIEGTFSYIIPLGDPAADTTISGTFSVLGIDLDDTSGGDTGG